MCPHALFDFLYFISFVDVLLLYNLTLQCCVLAFSAKWPGARQPASPDVFPVVAISTRLPESSRNLLLGWREATTGNTSTFPGYVPDYYSSISISLTFRFLILSRPILKNRKNPISQVGDFTLLPYLLNWIFFISLSLKTLMTVLKNLAKMAAIALTVWMDMFAVVIQATLVVTALLVRILHSCLKADDKFVSTLRLQEKFRLGRKPFSRSHQSK